MRKLKTFEQFPPDAICPVCGTSENGKTVLVMINETSKDGLCEAAPVHLACAVATHYSRAVGVLYTKTMEQP